MPSFLGRAGRICRKNDIKIIDSYQKEYSSSWIDDVGNQFGKNYLKSNRVAAIRCLHAISKISNQYIEDDLKDLVYIEAMLYGSYEDYFRLFLDFYSEELKADSQIKLKQRKDAAIAFLELIDDVSVTSMYNKSVLRDRAKINSNSAKAKLYNSNLAEYRVYFCASPQGERFRSSNSFKIIFLF
jgi:hypothetical protein